MKSLKGVFTALITPFQNGKVDFASLEKLVAHQIANGVDGFVISGTTGESPTLTKAERDQVFEAVRKQTGGQKVLILGTGSNSTEKTIEATKEAEKLGADAALVVVPYYNKPPQRGLYEHFKKTADSVSIPVILYNVPGRTITSLATETIRDLSKIKNIVGIKEATGNIEFAREIVKACGPEFIMLSGDDGTYAEFLAAGGHGVISVASHVLPKEFSAWTKAATKGDFALARAGIQKTLPLINELFSEANPIPVKKAVQMMGLISSPELRLPLVELAIEKVPALTREMKTCGVIA